MDRGISGRKRPGGVRIPANIEFRVPYLQRYLFNAIPDTNHNVNPTNPNHNSKGNPNLTDPHNTRYRCECGTLNSMFVPNPLWESSAPSTKLIYDTVHNRCGPNSRSAIASS